MIALGCLVNSHCSVIRRKVLDSEILQQQYRTSMIDADDRRALESNALKEVVKHRLISAPSLDFIERFAVRVGRDCLREIFFGKKSKKFFGISLQRFFAKELKSNYLI